MTCIRMPRLLDGDLREKARFMPLQLSLDRQLFGLSTARMTLEPEAPAIALRDLVELYDQQGSAGIFRVTQIEEDVGLTRTVTLTHALCTLEDGAVSPMAFTGTVRAALELLLESQPIPRWAVGEVEIPEDMTVILSTGYANLYTALEDLLGMLPEGYHLDFDQTGTPWLLHLRALPDEPGCEARLSRNLHSLHIATDSSRLCTRVYPFGAEVDETRLSLIPFTGQAYLQADTAEDWGVISRTFDSDLIFDAPTLHAVALLYLERHGTPEVTITLEGMDLATREDLDKFCLGRMCRIALPDMKRTLLTRITAIRQPDVFASPQQRLITLQSHAGQTRGEAEIDELIRQVTASKLLGGAVAEVEDDNHAYGTVSAPVVHYFDVNDWAELLDVRIRFSPDSGVRITDLRVDDVYPPDEVWRSGSFGAMAYLRRDELGCIAQGQHKLIFYPTTGTSGELAGVSSTVTMTVIESN